ncbi:MFS transporter [Tranquillimonas alkanivorans]|uniref:Predicted arabinose efflux permease, MFS family n=1 Tax=Tranquillimonas alkanivorans TaxID=441119 RepID=A0A1I5V955_9RHOB|nr:MFS transporter [Tranquillimonas alkanivorans]SFQ04104.1 Predicted arabinose efflux permease, MFS family [Tranquillimonas alkanivorans]
MLQVLRTSWPLLLGMGLLMVGNGLQGTLLGVRGGIEGFSTFEMSFVMSAYFLGFLGGSRLAPELIRRVGHIRVFAALGSFISAVLILYPSITEPWAWTLLRVIIGFCFSGVYVTAESWLNNSATNETRGQALSLYMIVQMVGIVSAQGLLNLGDPSGFILFVIPSVLVSISFAPILLSVNPTPAFGTAKPMSLMQLYAFSPLGCVGMFLMGGVFSALFGMASVYGTDVGLNVGQISIFIATIYIGGLVLQFPIGWASDRMDRRLLIMIAALAGGGAGLLAMITGGAFAILLVAAFLVGGTSNPLYSLLIAHTNDYLEHEDMAAASGGLIFINGVGAVAGPLITGWMMATVGAQGFWLYLAGLMLAVGAYAAFRMTQRAAPSVDETASYAPVLPTATPVAVEVAQEWAIDAAEEAASDQATGGRAA